MKKLAFLPLFFFLLAIYPSCSLAQSGSRPVYMQIFFEGPNWLAGHEVLQYSPAFKGKTGEMVAEGDDTRRLSPSHFLVDSPLLSQSGITTISTTGTDEGNFVRGRDGKMRPQTAEDIRKANQEEVDKFNKGFKLLEKRSGLARTALSNALNEVAADGWEVVQMTAYSGAGSLVYLLRKR